MAIWKWKRLGEGLRFVVWPGQNYKTKTQSVISFLVACDKEFNQVHRFAVFQDQN